MMRNGILFRREPLGHTISGGECLSEPHVPTPAACDHKGSGHPRKGRGPANNLRDWFRQNYGFLYPPVSLAEYLMGFPAGFSAYGLSATPSSPR